VTLSHTPDWVRDAVFYQIFPDRFAKSAASVQAGRFEAWDSPPTLFGFKGGDLAGVCERLGYLQELGFNALYLTPVFASTANHRYHTYDYFAVDPILGGNEALKRLLNEAHARGMRVVLDGVFNHASLGFYQFNHTLENGRDSPYVDWFHFNQAWLEAGKPLNAYASLPERFAPPGAESSLDLYGYRAWWDIPALPKFNTANPEVRAFLCRVAEHSIDFGIDGWRLDVPNEIDDDEFWRAFRRRVRARNPEAYIVGEIWDDARRWLAGDQFDGVMNYRFGRAVLGFCFAESLNHEELQRCGYRDLAPLPAETFAARLVELWEAYPRAAAECQLNMLGSHDTPRLLTMGQGDEAGVLLAMLALFAFVGAPCVYYGDEIGMSGGHDPDCRRSFEWDQALWNQRIQTYARACIGARHESPSLRRGDFRILVAADGIIAFSRKYGESEAVICLNVTREERQIELPLMRGQLTSRKFTGLVPPMSSMLAAAGMLRVRLAARSGGLWIGGR